MDAKLAQAAHWIASARKTIALTGAGVSTESGIPDFRGASGLWSRYDPAEYATLGAFLSDPEKVWAMLAELDGLLDAIPNPGHEALAKLEDGGGLAGIVTQNIDGLHQTAGSRNVIEFHGSNRSYTCLSCHDPFTRDAVRAMPRRSGSPMPFPEACRRIKDGGGDGGNGKIPCVIKPDVVFFDEGIPPQAIAGAAELVNGADLILVAGTSCEVYPAADIPLAVRRQGGRIIEINLQPEGELRADLVLRGGFADTASRLLDCWEKLRN